MLVEEDDGGENAGAARETGRVHNPEWAETQWLGGNFWQKALETRGERDQTTARQHELSAFGSQIVDLVLILPHMAAFHFRDHVRDSRWPVHGSMIYCEKGHTVQCLRTWMTENLC